MVRPDLLVAHALLDDLGLDFRAFEGVGVLPSGGIVVDRLARELHLVRIVPL